MSTRPREYISETINATSENSTQPSELLERRKRWIDLLHKKYYQPLIAEVLEHELPKYAGSISVLPRALSRTMQECALILASAPSVFAAALEGTLTRRYLIDADLQREYTMIQERARVQPSIYIHLLADENGIAPTANQYLRVRDIILQYMDTDSRHDELAWLVDNTTRPLVTRSKTATGHRKFLWTSLRSHRHVATLLQLCEGITKRWKGTPMSERDTPLEYPPGECGYSIDSHARLLQHRNRQSSNYVMSLVEDICTYLHSVGEFTQLFHMHQFIIYLIFRPQQAAIAEIFCSGLLQVWTEGGGGLNAYPAGRSVASARRVNFQQWEEHEQWVMENTDMIQNWMIQRERLEGDVMGLDRETEKIWREAMDSESGDNGDDPEDEDWNPNELGDEMS